MSVSIRHTFQGMKMILHEGLFPLESHRQPDFGSSTTPTPSTKPMMDSGIGFEVPPSPESEDSSSSAASSPSTEPLCDFGSGADLHPAPEPEDSSMSPENSPSISRLSDFGLRTSLRLTLEQEDSSISAANSPSASRLSDFGLRAGSLHPSPEPESSMSPTNFASTNRLSDFGLRAGHHRPTLEPEDSSTSAAICPSTKPKLFSDFGLRAILGPTLSKRDGARAVSPLPDAKEFGVLNVPEEESSLIGTHQPTDPKGRCEFHINSSYVHLTLVDAAWKWEKFPPSPRKGDEEGGTSEIGEAEHAVC